MSDLPELHREQPCHGSNYRPGRTGGVEYLVIHYVGGTGDAEANAKYYAATPKRNASAHYFVGHGPTPEIWQSVAEEDTAWHVGAKRYVHPRCRNDNSIGMELCCHREGGGGWYFDPETVAVAAALARDIVTRYNLGREQVLRHYDVTGKLCQEPFVRSEGAWETFRERLFSPGTEEVGEMKLYHHLEELPAWAREAAGKAVERGIIRQDETGEVNVYETNLQPLVWLDRLGLL